MKAKPFKATPVPNLAGAKASDRIARAEVVALVASRLSRREYDDDATARKRISAKVNYDVQWSRKLIEAAPRRFALGNVYVWANEEWPGQFEDLPHDCPIVVPAGTITVEGGVSAAVAPLPLPDDIVECHAAMAQMGNHIVALSREMEILRANLADSQAEARLLAVKAAKWDKWNATKGHKRVR